MRLSSDNLESERSTTKLLVSDPQRASPRSVRADAPRPDAYERLKGYVNDDSTNVSPEAPSFLNIPVSYEEERSLHLNYLNEPDDDARRLDFDVLPKRRRSEVSTFIEELASVEAELNRICIVGLDTVSINSRKEVTEDDGSLGSETQDSLCLIEKRLPRTAPRR